jgi:uncharacterized DUF497 family protein
MLDNEYDRRYIVDTNDIHFEWNPVKDTLNQRKHGVSFEEAVTVFSDRLYIEIADPDHSLDEERFIAFGISNHFRLLAVCYCVREDGETLRIISARLATAKEANQYGEKTNARRI